MVTKSKYLFLFLSFVAFASDDKSSIAQNNYSNLLDVITPITGIQNIIIGYFKHSKIISKEILDEHNNNPTLVFSPFSCHLALAENNSIDIYDMSVSPPDLVLSYPIDFPDNNVPYSFNRITDLAFSNDAKQIAFSTNSGFNRGLNIAEYTIKIIDICSCSIKQKLNFKPRRNNVFLYPLENLISVCSFSYSNDNKYFAFSDGYNITIVDKKENKEEKIEVSDVGNIIKIKFVDENSKHILIYKNQEISILNWQNKKYIQSYGVPYATIGNYNIKTNNYYHKNNDLWFSFRGTNIIAVWDITNNIMVNRISLNEKNNIHKLLFSSNDKYLVVCSDNLINLYDTSNYCLLENILDKSALSIAYSPNGKYIACRTREGVDIIQPGTTLTRYNDEKQINNSHNSKAYDNINNEAIEDLVQVNEKTNNVIKSDSKIKEEKSLKLKEEIQKCIACEAPNPEIQCKRCQKKLYCSLGCRTTDWENHLKICPR